MRDVTKTKNSLSNGNQCRNRSIELFIRALWLYKMQTDRQRPSNINNNNETLCEC